MDWMGAVGLVIGIVFGILGHLSSKALEKKLILEKDLIRDKILDMKDKWVSHRNVILNDRTTYNDNKRDTAHVRLEEIEANINVLDRFADRLKNLKK